MAQNTPTLPLCWPVTLWPERDRMLWQQAFDNVDPFSAMPSNALPLRADTLIGIRKGYGRWLAFLGARGVLDAATEPQARLTAPLLRAYFRELQARGNADATIVGRFTQLAMAIRILAPAYDASWIRKLDGISVFARLDRHQRPLRVPSMEALFAWGIDMMAVAKSDLATQSNRLAFRDGLLIAILACRARRRRSMASLRLGHEIFRRADRYRVELSPHQVKTARRDWFDLPEHLTPWIDIYVDTVRPALLAGQLCDAFWLTQHGRPLSEKSMSERIALLSRRRFGHRFGPHRFRHAIATGLAEHDPDTPGLAAGVLGISPKVVAEHYNRAQQTRACSRHADLIEQRRQNLLPMLRATR